MSSQLEDTGIFLFNQHFSMLFFLQSYLTTTTSEIEHSMPDNFQTCQNFANTYNHYAIVS